MKKKEEKQGNGDESRSFREGYEDRQEAVS